MATELVRLSVGGCLCITTRETLTAKPGTLRAMFQGEMQPSCLLTEDGSIFIDRDGTHFGTVLNYLRGGACVLPSSSQGRAELRREAEFYNLVELAELIDEREREVAVAASIPGKPSAAEMASHREALTAIINDIDTSMKNMKPLLASYLQQDASYHPDYAFPTIVEFASKRQQLDRAQQELIRTKLAALKELRPQEI